MTRCRLTTICIALSPLTPFVTLTLPSGPRSLRWLLIVLDINAIRELSPLATCGVTAFLAFGPGVEWGIAVVYREAYRYVRITCV